MTLHTNSEEIFVTLCDLKACFTPTFGLKAVNGRVRNSNVVLRIESVIDGFADPYTTIDELNETRAENAGVFIHFCTSADQIDSLRSALAFLRKFGDKPVIVVFTLSSSATRESTWQDVKQLASEFGCFACVERTGDDDDEAVRKAVLRAVSTVTSDRDHNRNRGQPQPWFSCSIQ
jgi:hypothetical protein